MQPRYYIPTTLYHDIQNIYIYIYILTEKHPPSTRIIQPTMDFSSNLIGPTEVLCRFG